MRIEMMPLSNGGLVPVNIYNSVIDGNGFYVSHNDHDLAIYGDETTALVLGQMERFYILNGDHRQQYAQLMGQGFDACLEYFKANQALRNHRSDVLPELAA